MYVTDGAVPCKEYDAEIWFSERAESKRTALAKGAVPSVH